MKKILLLTLVGLASAYFANAQTTLTVDANGVLNSSKIVTQTSAGQVFFTGHQLGTGYYYPAGIFRAITDNNNNAANYYFDGVTNGTTNFSVRADGQGYFAGNVGIGTTTPSARLSISGGALLMDNASWYSSKNASGTTTSLFGIGLDNNIYMGDLFGNDPTGNVIFRTNGVDQIRINPSGNVAIGTTDPKGYKLAVNGSVIATSMTVKVNSAWPDYVFKKDYQLPSLQDVKTYIDQNQHLPEVPSEQQIAKEGLNLGDMNKLLMKKVEELTLYLIDEHKKNKDQQVQIDQLKKEIQLLNKKLK
ncbi:hypothetical protein [Mucilaginibacter lappiensis]|uniref:Uncharacterized protein n=1 Tax=Mucilaginibacter lappiensis TaxID=354630 RepID=A0A841JQ06_9SPHI|nr:hypothetical protein [Mucilaginibacter lappiensis]MBB6129951.1 hypothetical protein [Mucilaginibacter lappiensis]